MRRVLVDHGTIEYELTYKRVKNLNLRVGATGEIRVSAPHRTPPERVDAFVRSRSAWIVTATERCRQAAARLHTDLTDGAPITVLGEQRSLHIVEGKPRSAELTPQTLTLFVRRQADAAAAYQKWQKEFCAELLTQYTHEIFDRMGLPQTAFPTLRFRSMTSRWGSCNKNKGTVTFNTRLSEKPYRLIEYVVTHELCHLLRADHSKEYYALLSQYLPDHMQRRRELK